MKDDIALRLIILFILSFYLCSLGYKISSTLNNEPETVPCNGMQISRINTINAQTAGALINVENRMQLEFDFLSFQCRKRHKTQL